MKVTVERIKDGKKVKEEYWPDIVVVGEMNGDIKARVAMPYKKKISSSEEMSIRVEMAAILLHNPTRQYWSDQAKMRDNEP